MPDDETRSRAGDVHLHSGPQLREYERLADRIAAGKPERVLDWGCGFGQVSRLLVDHGLSVESFDWSPDADGVQRVPLPRYPELDVTKSNEPVKLPYEESSFDAILSCGVLEHVQDPGGSLDELRRLLKPGGRLWIFKLPNTRSYLEWIARHTGGRMYFHGHYPDDRLYTLRSAKELVSAHGFEIDAARRMNMLPLTMNHKTEGPFSTLVWKLNRGLSLIPVVDQLATNVELETTKPTVPQARTPRIRA